MTAMNPALAGWEEEEKKFIDEKTPEFVANRKLTPDEEKNLKEEFAAAQPEPRLGPADFAAIRRQAEIELRRSGALDDSALRPDFEAGYTAPTPDDALKNRWKEEAQEESAPDSQQNEQGGENPYDYLAEDFVETHTAKQLKGKKSGPWASIMTNFFQKGLFDLLG